MQESVRAPLTPCIICEKAVMYLWDRKESTNLNSAVNIMIQGHYGSDYDATEFAGIICDECMDKLIQSKRLRFTRNLM